MLQHREFANNEGVAEHFISITSGPGNFPLKKLERLFKKFSINWSQLVLCKIFVKDITGEALLEKSPVWSCILKSSHSIIAQPTLEKGLFSFLFYFVKAPRAAKVKHKHYADGSNCAVFKFNNFRLASFCAITSNPKGSISKQTKDLLLSCRRLLKKHLFYFQLHSIRLWYFIPDIDNNYQEMVDSRMAVYRLMGLNSQNGYKASTGIEGFRPGNPAALSMDCLCYDYPDPNQYSRLSASNQMNEPIDYGVTFDRGTRIVWKDRTHYFISGTASINNKGRILHLNNPAKQTSRALKNIGQLLKPHGVGPEHGAYYIIYLRDKNHFRAVMRVFNSLIPGSIPRVVVKARVCRPGWLVEIEALVVGPGEKDYPAFA